MRKIGLFLLFISLIYNTASSQGVAINTDDSDADASAILDVKSTDQGMLIPRMTSTQRDDITIPATGLMIFDTSENGFFYYDGADWVAVGGGSASGGGYLGEVRMFALSLSGAITKAGLQSEGWAICDGTTATTQGISSATIENTPNLSNRFIRGSDDETSGITGGSDQHNHQWVDVNSFNLQSWQSNGATITVGEQHDQGAGGVGFDQSDGNLYTNFSSNLPSYYELAYFIKVK